MSRDIWLYFAFLALLVCLGFWWKASVWNECRAYGHGVMYCWRMVGR